MVRGCCVLICRSVVVVGLLVGSLFLTSFVGVVYAPSSTFQPADGDDVKFNDAYPTTNYGINSYLRVGDLWSDTSGNYERFVLKFDFSSLNSSTVVDNVTVSLFEFGAGKVGVAPENVEVEMYRSLRDWVESEATCTVFSTGNSWDTSCSRGVGVDYDSDLSASLTLDSSPANAFVDWYGEAGSRLVDDVQAWINGSYANNYGWVWRSSGENQPSGSMRYNNFYSSDYGGSGYDPKVVVGYHYEGEGGVTFTLTSYFYEGVDYVLHNGTVKENATSTVYNEGEVANLTGVLMVGFGLLEFRFDNNSVASSSNPYYLLVNETVGVWAVPYALSLMNVSVFPVGVVVFIFLSLMAWWITSSSGWVGRILALFFVSSAIYLMNEGFDFVGFKLNGNSLDAFTYTYSLDGYLLYLLTFLYSIWFLRLVLVLLFMYKRREIRF